MKRDNKYGYDEPTDAAAPVSPSSEPATSNPSSLGAADPGGAAAPEGSSTPQLAQGVLAAGQADQAQIDAAAARTGGVPPRAAPKGGEGTLAVVREVAHPELEPPPGPAEFRVAPAAPTEVDRPTFGDKPDYKALRDALFIEVQTVDELSAGIYVAGVLVQRTPTLVEVATILGRGENYLKGLLADPRIQLRIV
jgi:hypothetical protein